MEAKQTDRIIQTLEKQLSERLEKLWKLFNWSAGILVAMSAGIIVLLSFLIIKIALLPKLPS